MKKRMISCILSLALVFSLVPASFAAENNGQAAAQQLYEMGLFQGTGVDENGNPIFSLDRTPTRAEAVTMLVRLLGKEDAAKNGKWTIPFTDVAEWAKPYVGYAYANGLTTGTSATTFGGNATVNASQYLTFVLRALGYESGTDFRWDKAWELSDQIGLTSGEYDANTTDFTRGNVAVISRKGLDCKLKGSSRSLQDTFPVKVTSIQLNQSTLELEINESKLLIASVTPDNATDKTVVWKSSNSSVATVSGGKVKAIKSGSATITATASNGQQATCKVTVTAAPIVYSGNGDKVITGVNIPSGSYYAEYAHSGSRNFISKLVYGEKSYDYFRISNEIGNCSGQVALYDEGNVGVNDGILEVQADGNWKISFMPVAGITTTNITGTGERVTGLFTATTTNTVVSTTHFGNRNFIVKAIKYNGAKSYDYELITNEIGNYSGEKLIRLEKGAQYFFYVRADGDWTIDLGLGDTVTTYASVPSLPSSNNPSSTVTKPTDSTDSETRNVNVLVNYIKNYGTKTSSGRKIVKTDSDGAETSIAYGNNGELTFGFSYKSGGTTGYVLFSYDIATESVDKINVTATGQWIPPVISGNANFDISSYTSTTNLNFSNEDGSLSADNEELLNLLVRVAIPSFGILIVDTAGITLADIGFDSY